ncbi:MAG: hypothetical protein QXF15_03325 [Candidatus Aenigmatarchaeota archaeon]
MFMLLQKLKIKKIGNSYYILVPAWLKDFLNTFEVDCEEKFDKNDYIIVLRFRNIAIDKIIRVMKGR